MQIYCNYTLKRTRGYTKSCNPLILLVSRDPFDALHFDLAYSSACSGLAVTADTNKKRPPDGRRFVCVVSRDGIEPSTY